VSSILKGLKTALGRAGHVPLPPTPPPAPQPPPAPPPPAKVAPTPLPPAPPPIEEDEEFAEDDDYDHGLDEPIDLSEEPETHHDPLTTNANVPLSTGEADELMEHVQQWVQDEPSNVFPYQIRRMLHELREYRLRQADIALGAGNSAQLEIEVSMLRKQLAMSEEEVKKLKAALKVTEEMAKVASDEAFAKVDLGGQIDELSIENLFAAQSRLPDER
jgi:hypothetical protein